MIESISEMAGMGLACVILAAWRSVPILGVVLLLDLLLRRRLKARFQCFLWLLVLGRLVLPFSFSSPLSVADLADHAAMQTEQFIFEPPQQAKPEFDVVTLDLASGETVSLPVLEEDVSEEVRERANSFAAGVHATRIAERSNTSQSTFNSEEFDETWIAYPLIWTWLVISLSLIGLGSIQFYRFSRMLNSCPKIVEPRLVESLADACRSIGISRMPEMRQVNALSAPSVFGVWKPVLCLTSQVDLAEEELVWVLRHELSHIKRWDSMVLSIAQSVRAFHWFNPIAWIVVGKLRTRIEQAADDLATKGLSTEQLVQYGQLLLRSAQDRPSRNFATVGLLSYASNKSLKRRIEMLGQSQGRRPWSIRLLSIILFSVLALAGLTDAPAEKIQSQVEPSIPKTTSVELSEATTRFHANQTMPSELNRNEQEELVTLEVESVLEKARTLQPGIDEELFLRTYFALEQWDGTIEDGKIHVMLTPSRARICAEMLQGFRIGDGLWQVSIECRMVKAHVSIARSLKWNSTAFTAEGNILSLGPSYSAADLQKVFNTKPTLEARVSEIDLGLLIHRYQNDRRTNSILAPKVTVFNGQSVTITDHSVRPFVTSISIDRKDASQRFQPQIEIVPEGVTLKIHAQFVEPNRVELDCIITETDIQSVEFASLPIASPEDPKQEVMIQTPQVHRTHLGSHVQLANNESICLFSPKSHSKEPQAAGMGQFYILTPRLIDDSESLKSFVRK